VIEDLDPVFGSVAAAMEYAETVRDWYAIVHPGCGFYPVFNPKASRIANRTRAKLEDHSIQIKVDGVETDFVPVQPMENTPEGWCLCDGTYGLCDHCFDACGGDEEKMDTMVDEVMAEIWRGLETGYIGGKTSQGIEWRFMADAEYQRRLRVQIDTDNPKI
jgi:hypothetical protein